MTNNHANNLSTDQKNYSHPPLEFLMLAALLSYCCS